MTEKKKSDCIQEFLEKIGPRALTDAEARELHLLRIRAGKDDDISGVIEKLAGSGDAKGKSGNKS